MKPSEYNSFNDIIVNALNKYIIPLAAALAVGFVIYGGVLYIMSGGDPEKTGKAKKTILWAIVGVFLVALSYLIVKMTGNVIRNNIL
jgi:hypothetical protein